MQYSNSPNSATGVRILPCLLIFALAVPASWPAWAQTTPSSDDALASVALSDTPEEVTNGNAILLGRYNPASKLRLILGLNPPKLEEEERFLQELQDKKSPNFHKYLTAEQWNDRFAPSAEEEQAVVDWATKNGLTVTDRSPYRLIVEVEGTSATIEKAFAIEINSYQVGENVEFSNDRDPIIPTHLTGILHSVGGLNSIQRFYSPHEDNTHRMSVDYSPGAVSSLGPSMRAAGNRAAYEEAVKAAAARAGSSSGNNRTVAGENQINGVQPPVAHGRIEPMDIYSSNGYDFGALQNQGHCCNPTGNSGGSTPTTSIAIAAAADFANSDIVGFHDQYGFLAFNVHRVFIDGTPNCCSSETTADTEWASALANSFGSPTDTAQVWVYEGANSLNSTFSHVYMQMLIDGHARVFSTSWGCSEIKCIPASRMDTDHAIFNAMVGEGWTVVALSHDWGATAGCGDADRVSYPGSDPDNVSVGGTTLKLSSEGVFESETAWQGDTYAGACGKKHGGSGGGCSVFMPNTAGYQSDPYCGGGSRSVPDVALNASQLEQVFYNGKLTGFYGTSISTPMVAGFMAQANAYLLSLGNICGVNNGTLPCAPMGQVDYSLYYEGYHPDYAPHYPFYDILTGCNNNDITALYGLNFYCAGPGYDAITGWGSFNALQLAWMINWSAAADTGRPEVSFGGPTTGKWYNSDQLIDWTVTDTGGDFPATGVAGFSQAWDADPGDVGSEATQGTGNSFYSGPQSPKKTFGCTDITGALCTGASVGQGCHTVNVRAWDNMGYGSGDKTYGPICYDTVAPITTDRLSGTLSGSLYENSVTVTLSARDLSPGSGVKSTTYQINGGSVATYTAPFAVSSDGANTVTFHSTDVAGNVETTESANFGITSTTTTALSSSINPAPFGKRVKFTAIVTATLSGTPTGTVTFKQGTTVLATKTLSGGMATHSTVSLPVGSDPITATYNGATYFLGSTSSTLTEVIQNPTNEIGVP